MNWHCRFGVGVAHFQPPRPDYGKPMIQFAPSRRTRRTPFSDAVEAAGVSAYSVYNRMLIPAVFRSLEEDYRHLKSAVQVWDVSCERQVEVSGPDADQLIRLLTPRNLDRMADDQCFYVPVVNALGGMLNDPVALKPDEDRWWISIADSDLLQWVMGLATGRGFDVKVHEPDVSPLAVQGPKAEDLMARVFGGGVKDIGFFRYKKLNFGGKSFVVARSGYSKQGGFEIYVEGGEHGLPLWNALFEAGKDLDVHAGCPNLIERVEGGLLSYGNDMRIENTPYECGLGKFCNGTGDYIGKAALAAKSNPERQIRAISVSGAAAPKIGSGWTLRSGDAFAGRITSAAWSPDFETIVSVGMVEADFWAPGTTLSVETPDGPREARVQEAFWASHGIKEQTNGDRSVPISESQGRSRGRWRLDRNPEPPGQAERAGCRQRGRAG